MDARCKDAVVKFKDHIDKLKDAGRRINNSAKLIDFFVHDILDYAVLKGK